MEIYLYAVEDASAVIRSRHSEPAVLTEADSGDEPTHVIPDVHLLVWYTPQT